ncbi:hypothetical protein K4K60_012325 [Colletotrichum sp. SAR11_57]|nr:hypothetical protein K4K60_012325 [Colletotrichum sp. SAR11_57]
MTSTVRGDALAASTYSTQILRMHADTDNNSKRPYNFKGRSQRRREAHGFDDKVGTATLGHSLDLSLQVRHAIKKVQRLCSKLLRPPQSVFHAVDSEETLRSKVGGRNDGTQAHGTGSHNYDRAVTDSHTGQHFHTAFYRIVPRGKYVGHEDKCLVGDCRWRHDSCGISQWNSNILRLPAI